jgi:hypothetical protein
MIDEYGTDDIDWLIEHGDRPGMVAVSAHGRLFHVPIVRFDNRVDRTSFLRDDQETWDAEMLGALHRDLVNLLGRFKPEPGTPAH